MVESKEDTLVKDEKWPEVPVAIPPNLPLATSSNLYFVFFHVFPPPPLENAKGAL
jgi:hypothetical protein